MITKNEFISRKPYHAPTVKIVDVDGERLMAGSPDDITGNGTGHPAEGEWE